MGKVAPEYRQAKSFGRHTTKHRAIYEAHVGYALPRLIHVHHINGDKSDNRIGNLEAIPAHIHGLMHAPPILPVVKSCVVCGTEYRPHKTKRRRQQTCGQRCRCALISRNSTSAKLSRQDRIRICVAYMVGESQASIARRYGVSQPAISYVRKKACAYIFASAIYEQLEREP